jgi:hypothetical protein
MFVLVSTEFVMMGPVVGNPTSCEIHAVTRFFRVKNMSAEKIHHELYTMISGQNVMSEGTVRQW